MRRFRFAATVDDRYIDELAVRGDRMQVDEDTSADIASRPK